MKTIWDFQVRTHFILWSFPLNLVGLLYAFLYYPQLIFFFTQMFILSVVDSWVDYITL